MSSRVSGYACVLQKVKQYLIFFFLPDARIVGGKILFSAFLFLVGVSISSQQIRIGVGVENTHLMCNQPFGAG